MVTNAEITNSPSAQNSGEFASARAKGADLKSDPRLVSRVAKAYHEQGLDQMVRTFMHVQRLDRTGPVKSELLKETDSAARLEKLATRAVETAERMKPGLDALIQSGAIKLAQGENLDDALIRTVAHQYYRIARFDLGMENCEDQLAKAIRKNIAPGTIKEPEPVTPVETPVVKTPVVETPPPAPEVKEPPAPTPPAPLTAEQEEIRRILVKSGKPAEEADRLVREASDDYRKIMLSRVRFDIMPDLACDEHLGQISTTPLSAGEVLQMAAKTYDEFTADISRKLARPLSDQEAKTIREEVLATVNDRLKKAGQSKVVTAQDFELYAFASSRTSLRVRQQASRLKLSSISGRSSINSQ